MAGPWLEVRIVTSDKVVEVWQNDGIFFPTALQRARLSAT